MNSSYRTTRRSFTTASNRSRDTVARYTRFSVARHALVQNAAESTARAGSRAPRAATNAHARHARHTHVPHDCTPGPNPGTPSDRHEHHDLARCGAQSVLSQQQALSGNGTPRDVSFSAERSGAGRSSGPSACACSADRARAPAFRARPGSAFSRIGYCSAGCLPRARSGCKTMKHSTMTMGVCTRIYANFDRRG